MSFLKNIGQQADNLLNNGISAVENKYTGVKSFLKSVSNKAEIYKSARDLATKFKGKTNLKSDPEWNQYPIELRLEAYKIMQEEEKKRREEEQKAQIEARDKAKMNVKSGQIGIQSAMDFAFPTQQDKLKEQERMMPTVVGGEVGRKPFAQGKSFFQDVAEVGKNVGSFVKEGVTNKFEQFEGLTKQWGEKEEEYKSRFGYKLGGVLSAVSNWSDIIKGTSTGAMKFAAQEATDIGTGANIIMLRGAKLLLPDKYDKKIDNQIDDLRDINKWVNKITKRKGILEQTGSATAQLGAFSKLAGMTEGAISKTFGLGKVASSAISDATIFPIISALELDSRGDLTTENLVVNTILDVALGVAGEGAFKAVPKIKELLGKDTGKIENKIRGTFDKLKNKIGEEETRKFLTEFISKAKSQKGFTAIPEPKIEEMMIDRNPDIPFSKIEDEKLRVKNERFLPLKDRVPQKLGVKQIEERIDLYNRIIDSKERLFGDVSYFIPKIEKEEVENIKNFIKSVGEEKLKDVRLSIRRIIGNKVAGNFDFENSIITIARESMVKGVAPDRTMIHEMWHSLSRYLPDKKISLFNNEFKRNKSIFKSDNPWFKFVDNNAKRDSMGNYILTKELHDKFVKKFKNKDRFRKLNDNEFIMLFDNNTYRYKNIDEFFAEELTDRAFIFDFKPEAKSIIGKIKNIFFKVIDYVKEFFGKPTSREITERTYDDFLNKRYKNITRAGNLEGVSKIMNKLEPEVELAQLKTEPVQPKAETPKAEPTKFDIYKRYEEIVSKYTTKTEVKEKEGLMKYISKSQEPIRKTFNKLQDKVDTFLEKGFI